MVVAAGAWIVGLIIGSSDESTSQLTSDSVQATSERTTTIVPSTPCVSSGARKCFNTFATDKPTTRVANGTLNPECSECWSNVAEAEVGDAVSVLIYYHNTSLDGIAAEDTRIKVVPKIEPGRDEITMIGKVWAENAPEATGPAAIRVQPTEEVASVEWLSTDWFPNQSVSAPVPLGEEVRFAGGVSIGRIEAAFASQGQVVVRFRIAGVGSP